MWLLLAQTDLGGGVAGWSSFGIAGLVLAWLLLKHLPEKDRQIRDLIDLHLKTEENQRKVHADLEREQRDDFRRTLDSVMEHWTKQTESLANALRTDLVAVQHAVEAVNRAIEGKH